MIKNFISLYPKSKLVCQFNILKTIGGFLTGGPVGAVTAAVGDALMPGSSAVDSLTGAASTHYAATTAANAARDAQEFNKREADTQRQWTEGQFQKSMDFNAGQAEINRQFQADQVSKAQEYNTAMSNSAYQRATADMKKAGINPMLAYMQGGASSPTSQAASGSSASASSGSGSTASGVKSDAAEYLSRGVQNNISNAFEAKRVKKDLEVGQSQVNANNAVAHNNHAQALVANKSAAKIIADTERIKQDTHYDKLEKDVTTNPWYLHGGRITDIAASALPWTAATYAGMKLVGKYANSAKKVDSIPKVYGTYNREGYVVPDGARLLTK